ncbi:MAG TPA: hypothetical protein V6D02_07005 [Candidatus Obscuribacterales bacterium]
MSAAEHQSPNASSQAESKPLSKPPQRPSLLQPPARPTPPSPPPVPVDAAPPVSTVPAAAPPPAAAAPIEATPAAPSTFTNHPIAPPSEPMQYRAIGLVRGVYQPSEEQLNRGNILADDGAVIDAVLLGRVTSLIKKHIDLESSHLWVVYPRTRQPFEDSEPETDASDGSLHLQIVGVWEPETLGMPGENPHTRDPEAEADSDADNDDDTATALEGEAEDAGITPAVAIPSENYFSIRGEVIDYNEDESSIMVKIVQSAKRSGKPPKAFKLHINGTISGKTVGYFWELEIERQGEQLMLTTGRAIAIVPPKKKKKGRPFGPRGGGGRRPGPAIGSKPKPTIAKDKPRIRPSAPVKSNPL